MLLHLVISATNFTRSFVLAERQIGGDAGRYKGTNDR